MAHTRSSPPNDATIVPVKASEYMATGRPIGYAGRGIAADRLRKMGCAVTVIPEGPEAIISATPRHGLIRELEQTRVLGYSERYRVQAYLHRG